MKVMSGPGGRLEEKRFGKLTYGKLRLHRLAPHTLVLSFCMSRFLAQWLRKHLMLESWGRWEKPDRKDGEHGL